MRPTHQLPARVGEFGLADSATSERPNGGVRYRYHGRGALDVDVYLAPLFPQGALCYAECRAAAAKVLSADVRSSLDSLQPRGVADSAKMLGEEDVSTPFQSWLAQGRHLSFVTYRGGVPSETHVYLFAGREQLLTIRGSFAPTREARSRIGDFVSDLLPNVEPPYRCADGLAHTSGMLLGVLVPMPAAAAAARVDSLLGARGYPMDYASQAAGRWRTWPHVAFRADAAPTTEDRAAVIIYSIVAPVRDSTGIEISAVALCDAGDRTAIIEIEAAFNMTAAVSAAFRRR